MCDTASLFISLTMRALVMRSATLDNHRIRICRERKGSCRIVLGGAPNEAVASWMLPRSPIRVLFPRTVGTKLQEAVLVNTSGALPGGDALNQV